MRRLSLVLALCLPVGAVAQEPLPVPTSGVLTIDRDRLYTDSETGRRIEAEIQAEATALQAENDRIEAQLIAEERDLAKRRPGMDPALFREEAEAFNSKVQDIRRAQDSKIADLERRSQQRREAFLTQTRGIVGQLMLERGGVVILDRRIVYIAVGSIDITDAAIARIDAAADAADGE